jgi:hypothetical protein
MRGSTVRQLSMLSAVSPDELVPARHPIRRIRPVVDLALSSLAPTFDAKGGVPGPMRGWMGLVRAVVRGPGAALLA